MRVSRSGYSDKKAKIKIKTSDDWFLYLKNKNRNMLEQVLP